MNSLLGGRRMPYWAALLCFDGMPPCHSTLNVLQHLLISLLPSLPESCMHGHTMCFDTAGRKRSSRESSRLPKSTRSATVRSHRTLLKVSAASRRRRRSLFVLLLHSDRCMGRLCFKHAALSTSDVLAASIVDCIVVTQLQVCQRVHWSLLKATTLCLWIALLGITHR